MNLQNGCFYCNNLDYIFGKKPKCKVMPKLELEDTGACMTAFINRGEENEKVFIVSDCPKFQRKEA